RVRCRGIRRLGLARRLLHRLSADGPDPDIRGGVRLLAGGPPQAVRPHRHQLHAVRRGADRTLAAHRRVAALHPARADPPGPPARPARPPFHMPRETAPPAPADLVRSSDPAPAAKTRSHWLWLAAVAIALALPWLFFNWSTGRHSGFVLIMLSEIGLMTIFAL